MVDPTDRLIESTRRRLAAVTLGLIALLLVAVGVVTAIAGLRALDADVDRALEAAGAAAVARVETGVALPPSGEHEDAPAASQTFVLYLDASGTVVANPSGITLPDLPDPAAVEAASASGRDLRTIDAGGTSVRLLTLPVSASGEAGEGSTGSSGSPGPSVTAASGETEGGGSGGGARVGTSEVAFVQTGFVLTLHDRQSASLLVAIAVVGLVGLVGAAIVTVVVTGRALVPIRRTFDAQRRFVADASHELRTPAAIIRSTAEVIEREDLVAPDGRPLVRDIVSESDRLGRLVADLLSLAGAEAGAMTLRRERVDVADLARETIRRTEPLASERAIALVVDGAPHAVASGDRDRLVQLLVILLDNAIDHSPDGGTVTVRIGRSGRVVEIDVDDEGPGIAQEDRQRIFEPFARVAGVERDRAGGTGLGLAIARRIVAAHDGTIVAEESSKGGASFRVTLPGPGDSA
jgi:signal transduction histidine kinase